MGYVGTTTREGMLAAEALSDGGQFCDLAALQIWHGTDVVAVQRLRFTAADGAFGAVRLSPADQGTVPTIESCFRARADESHRGRPFAISPPTVRHVRAGFDALNSDDYRVLSGDPEVVVIADPSDYLDDAWLRGFVSDRLVGLLSTIADLFQARGTAEHSLLGSRGFSPGIEPLLLERIPCVPRSFPDFLASLCMDIRTSLIREGRLQFGWGTLVMRGVDITMLVDPPAPPKRKLGQAVRRVE